jgi:hypothetical protein
MEVAMSSVTVKIDPALRFVTIADVCEMLSISEATARR